MKTDAIYHRIIVIISSLITLISFILYIISIYVPNSSDPYVGSYDVHPLDSGWELTVEGDESSTVVDFPITRNDLVGKTISLKTTLPNDVTDGMMICARSTMNDLYIYVDGSLRADYASSNYDVMSYNPPSAYVFCDLTDRDAGKTIEIKQFLKTSGAINQVEYGYGANSYYKIYEDNRHIAMTSYVLMALGIVVMAIHFIMSRRRRQSGSLLYIGELTLTMGIWLIGESRLRQWLLSSQYLTAIYCYTTIELIALFAILYFDTVQKRRYHKLYQVLETLVLGQFLLNVLLSLTGIANLYHTLMFSHVWMGLSIIASIAAIIIDFKKKYIREYPFIGLGMGLFILSSFGELLAFYVNRHATLGFSMSIGIIILVICTLIQTVYDEIGHNKEQLEAQERFTLSTLESFADAIDAKDEYTGNHSYRVAHYASTLARAISEKYHFTDVDILKIHYTGLMHDIGKIALPDSILSFSGELSEDEEVLLKQHVTIGEKLLVSLENVEWLSDGIRHHHERFDGTGYPDGLSGKYIPLVARIISIANYYDYLNHNSTMSQESPETIRRIIMDEAGKRFDPELASLFVHLIEKGAISPVVADRDDAKDSDTPKQSAVLDMLIHRKITGNNSYRITSPGHIRMVSYIARLAERGGSKVDIYLIGFSDPMASTMKPEAVGERLQQIKEALNSTTTLHDILIDFTSNKLLLMYIDRNDSDIASALASFTELGIKEELFIKRLTPQMVESIDDNY